MEKNTAIHQQSAGELLPVSAASGAGAEGVGSLLANSCLCSGNLIVRYLGTVPCWKYFSSSLVKLVIPGAFSKSAACVAECMLVPLALVLSGDAALRCSVSPASFCSA